MGRPREFDLATALASALDVFWRQGFEGASMADLTAAMGINRPSLYAAFGNKEALFHKALDHYEATYMGFIPAALAAPTAREAIERLLYGYADLQTGAEHPPGGLETNGALACSEAAAPIREALCARRRQDEFLLARRLERARAEGDLGPGIDPAALAQFVMAIACGMSVKAASGADRRALHQVVETALRAVPGAAVAA
jgi:AcrR family transcriptional regulator